MRIVIAGGSGFLGRPLAARLQRGGHQVVVLSRRPSAATDVAWSPDGAAGPWAASIDGVDALVNLAGESIAGRRWTTAQKAAIRESRLRATRSLVAAIGQAARPPATLVSASAVGYYGPRGQEPIDEGAAPGDDFLARVCREWEAEALRASGGSRVVLLRTGIVLEKDGGALPQMALPFRLFAGGPVGSGRQYYSWIHRDDWLEIVAWALERDVSGPLNMTAPNPVTNRAFAQALGRVLRRPSFMPAPAFALRIALGEMADALLLTGQRVLPAKAEAHGYRFRHPMLEGALDAIYG